MIYIFDIETNGLLPWLVKPDEKFVDKFLGGCIKDIDGNVVYSGEDPAELISHLNRAELIVGHNIISFDIPCLEYLTGLEVSTKPCDTMILTLLAHPDLKNEEFLQLRKGNLKVPTKLIGSHKLEAWGMRLGEPKGDPGCADWYTAEWTEEMEQYCKQDVEVTRKLYKKFCDYIPENVLELEHAFGKNMAIQQKNGVLYDVAKGKRLEGILRKLLDSALKEVHTFFPPEEKFIRHGYKMYIDDDGKRRRSKEKMDIYKTVVFNPASDKQLYTRLMDKYDWKPIVKTKTGLPKVSEDVLSELDYPCIPSLLRYLMLAKRLGQLTDGNKAHFKYIREDGRIHASVNSLGAVSNRCTHANPNLAQVPKCGVRFGKAFRSLFKAPEGKSIVGCDAKGLELRCLGHYLGRYDSGAYTTQILEGDIHTANQHAAGLSTRDQAKTFIYALIYGAGDEKIGGIIGKGRRGGARIKQKFTNDTIGFSNLLRNAQLAAKRGYIVAIDGRRLPVRSAHSCLNLLLQSCGAIVMKKAQVILQNKLDKEGIEHSFVLNIHDEFQIEVDTEYAEDVAKYAVWSIQEAGIQLNFRCPLDGDAKIGRSWKETH